MRDEGTKTIRNTSVSLVIGSLLIAFLNLLTGRAPVPAPSQPKAPAARKEGEERLAFSTPLE
jgi:hypothetical protein